MKKQNQLGMNPSTASNRLVKDLLWNFVETTGQGTCCKCGEPMSRDSFSIEHVTPWLDTDNPVEMYFNLSNIGYSHRLCNISSARRAKSLCGTKRGYDNGCRCDPCKVESSRVYSNRYSKESRRERYTRTGR